MSWDTKSAESVSADCRQQLRRDVINPLVGAMDSRDQSLLSFYRKLFDAEDISDPLAFADAAIGMGEQIIQMDGVKALCDSLQDPAGAMVGYAKQAVSSLKNMKIRLIDNTAFGHISTDATRYSEGVGPRQWNYQQCMEIGGVEIANPNEAKSLLSTKTSMIPRRTCHDVFGISKHPEVKTLNKLYFEKFLDARSASHILIVNGENDPVSTLSITKNSYDHSLNPNLRILTVKNGNHHEEMNASEQAPRPEVQIIRTQIEQIIRGWL